MNRIILFIISLIAVVLLLVFFFNPPKNNQLNSAADTSDHWSKAELSTQKKSASWNSSLWNLPSDGIFIHPYSFKVLHQGVQVSIPQVAATEKVVFGSHDPWCTVDFGEEITAVKAVSHGDWSSLVEYSLRSGVKAELAITQGSPFLYFRSEKNMHITCEGAKLESAGDGAVIKKEGLSSIMTWQKKGEAEARLGFVPEFQLADRFFKEPWGPLLETTVNWEVASTDITTTFSFSDDSWQEPRLLLIYPHHYQQDKLDILGSYSSVLGPIELVESTQNNLVTTHKNPLLFADFKPVQGAQKDEIIRLIKEDSVRLLSATVPEGVYFRGVWLGSASTLYQLANAYNQEELAVSIKEKMVEVLKSDLTSVSFDEKSVTMVHKFPEFGHERGSDHHFHYGYFLRAMAILSDGDSELQAEYSSVAALMIQDIASSDRSGVIPFLRPFSVFEGHSWADGNAAFADGNNQESTSEALQAWYGVWLWADITQDQALKDQATWMFSQELAAAESYWFGVANPFPPEYTSPLASLVWGGKREFATWFSPQPHHVIGIQFLPVTPSSWSSLPTLLSDAKVTTYLSNTPDITGHEWSDLSVAGISFIDPDFAVRRVSSVKTYEGLKLKSLFYHTVYFNAENTEKN